MSSPYALPAGPTRFADSKTSSPPPEPRSRTISPGFSRASAVGLPHPSDASIAASGTCPACKESYRLEVIGSHPRPFAPLAPQQALLPLFAWRAAFPYVSLTMSLISLSLMMKPSPMYAVGLRPSI